MIEQKKYKFWQINDLISSKIIFIGEDPNTNILTIKFQLESVGWFEND